MTNYFKDCKTKDDVKQLYREYAKKFHPDAGGKAELMIELQRQYENWKPPSPFSNNKQYGGFGGYRYANQGSMWNEYKQQAHDPRFADYERMKSENISLKCSVNVLTDLNVKLVKENEALKKKLERLKKKLSLPSKAKKVGKNSPSICL